MRRRTVAITLLTAAAAIGITTPASATGTVTLPSPFSTYSIACDNSSPPDGTYTRVNGPGTPPAGTGSLELATGATPTIFGPIYNANIPVADLDAWAFSHYEAGSATGQLVVEMQVDRDGDGVNNDLLDMTPTETGGVWQNFDVLAQTMAYTPDHSATGGGDISWSDYVTAHPNAVVDKLLFVMDGCSANQVAYLDNWVVTVNGTAHSYNFEAAPAVTASSSASTITAGKPVTIRSNVIGDGVPMASQQVELWAKTYPATTFRLIDRVTTNSLGAASSVQHPLRQTTYQWHVNADGFDAATSPTRTVKVRTALTINVLDATLARGQSLVLWGSTTPVHAGATVTLMRRTSSGARKVAATTTRPDGTYLFQRKLFTGKYRLFTKIGAGTGDLAGTSADVTVKAS